MKLALVVACILLVSASSASGQPEELCPEDDGTVFQLTKERSDVKRLLRIKDDRKWWLGTIRDLDYGERARLSLPNLAYYGQKVDIALPRGFKNLSLSKRLEWQRKIAAAVKELWSNVEATPRESLAATIAFKDQQIEELYQKRRDGKCQGDERAVIVDVSGVWRGSNNQQYALRQNGKDFSWNLPAYRENGNGSVDGTTVKASWSGGNGSGSATGQITQIVHKRATRIEWSNGIVFSRD